MIFRLHRARKINHSGSFGPQAVFHYQLEALRNVRLTDKYYFQFGVVSEQFIFSRSNSLYPYSNSSMAGELSLAYWTGDDFYPLLKFEPGVYYTRDYITKNSFDVPIRAVSGFKASGRRSHRAWCNVDPFEQVRLFQFAVSTGKSTINTTCERYFPNLASVTPR